MLFGCMKDSLYTEQCRCSWGFWFVFIGYCGWKMFLHLLGGLCSCINLERDLHQVLLVLYAKACQIPISTAIEWPSLLWFGDGVLQVWRGVTCLGSSTWHMPSAFLFSLPFGVAGWYVPLTPCYCIDIGCPVLTCHPLSSPQYVGWLVLWSILLLAPVLCNVFSSGCSQWNYYLLVFNRYINACFYSIL